MAIYAFEAGQELTLDNMQRYPTRHPRCGTSFLFLVMMICILLFSVVDALYIRFIDTVRDPSTPLQDRVSIDRIWIRVVP